MTVLDSSHDGTLTHRANLNIAAAVVARLGLGASDSLIGHVINDVRTRHSVAELANSGGMSGLLGAVDTAIARTTEASRPFNATDSRAAQLAAQAAGGGGLHGWHGDGFGHGRYALLKGGRIGREADSEAADSDGKSGGGSGTGRSGSLAISGTGGEPAGSPFWGTAKGMLLTRSYANDNAMNWAPSDLMKMGRPALQALKESGLKGEGYQRLRKPSGLNFDNPTIVNGAKYFKDNGGDYEGASRDMDEVHRGLHGKNKDRFRGAITEFVDPDDKLDVEEKRKRLGKQFDALEQEEPDAKPGLDKLRRRFDVKQEAAPKAEAAAQKNDAAAKHDAATAKKNAAAAKQAHAGAQKDNVAAKKDDAEAKRKDAKADASAAQERAARQRQDSTKSKLLSMYN